MNQLCDNHLCIPMLKKVLPELRNFVHDTSEKVRHAVFDLLLKVKGLRSIKFWTVVPVEHVLARLDSDTPSICRKIMKLIHSSFVPIDLPPAEQVCISPSTIKVYFCDGKKKLEIFMKLQRKRYYLRHLYVEFIIFYFFYLTDPRTSLLRLT